MSSIDNQMDINSSIGSPLQIDLPAVLRKKLGDKRARRIPRVLVRLLEKIIDTDSLNDMLASCHPKRGAEFAKALIDYLGVRVHVSGEDRLPPVTERRIIFACNHPMGGVEGIALIAWMHRRYGGEVYVMVNDILMAVEPLKEVFLPINKHGRQSHSSAQGVERVLMSDNPILIFPSGLVSRLNKDGVIADKPWRKYFVNAAIKYQRQIVPLYCDGRNSNFFYRFARLRERLGIKINLEMVRLPREVTRMKVKDLHIVCGQAVDHKQLRGGSEATDTALKIRETSYALKSQVNENSRSETSADHGDNNN